MEIHEKIQKYRKEKKFTQGELAQKSGMSITSIRRYENATTSPDINALNKIAHALDIELQNLLSDDSFGALSSIGNNIKRFRTLRKISQKTLAKKVQMNLSTLQKYEDDDPSIEPSILKLQRIADVFNVWTVELIGLKNFKQSDGDRIFYSRAKKRIKRKDLAKSLEITDEELKLYEEGALKPSSELKKEIANMLAIPIEEIFPTQVESIEIQVETPIQNTFNKLTEDEQIDAINYMEELIQRRTSLSK